MELRLDSEDRIELLEARVENLLILKQSLERSLAREREKNETLELLIKKGKMNDND
jgi:hypothetical protein